jgi:hypothetical protein
MPLFQLLGSPAKDKRHVIFEGAVGDLIGRSDVGGWFWRCGLWRSPELISAVTRRPVHESISLVALSTSEGPGLGCGRGRLRSARAPPLPRRPCSSTPRRRTRAYAATRSAAPGSTNAGARLSPARSLVRCRVEAPRRPGRARTSGRSRIPFRAPTEPTASHGLLH